MHLIRDTHRRLSLSTPGDAWWYDMICYWDMHQKLDQERFESFEYEFVLCLINVFSKICPWKACELYIGFSYEFQLMMFCHLLGDEEQSVLLIVLFVGVLGGIGLMQAWCYSSLRFDCTSVFMGFISMYLGIIKLVNIWCGLYFCNVRTSSVGYSMLGFRVGTCDSFRCIIQVMFLLLAIVSLPNHNFWMNFYYVLALVTMSPAFCYTYDLQGQVQGVTRSSDTDFDFETVD